MSKKRWQIVCLSAGFALMPLAAQAERVEEEPNAGEMALDLMVARPVGIGIFALGSVTYIATLPFSLLGGNSGEAANALVIEPAKEVFVRCLGCTRPGRKEKIREERRRGRVGEIWRDGGEG